MNSKWAKIRAALLFGALLAVAFLTWRLVTGSGEADTATRLVPAGGDTRSATNSMQPSGGSAQLGNSQVAGNKASASQPTSARLSWKQDMLQMLQAAPTAENVASRSYAVYMSSWFCTTWSTAYGNGASTLEADVPAKRISHNENALQRIAKRCKAFYGVDNLRASVMLALKAENAPMPAFLSARDNNPEQARAQLTRMLTDYDATALQPLVMVWPLMNTDRLATTLPDELKPYAQGIVTAAFDIALCRAGAYCGAGSVALDMVCMKFAECDAADVEMAYRRLHSANGISFDETSRMADSIKDAIKRKDANALWPDTAKWPRTRK